MQAEEDSRKKSDEEDHARSLKDIEELRKKNQEEDEADKQKHA